MDYMLQHPLFQMLIKVGVIFIVVSVIMWRFPTKSINALYGYRTSASMKNQTQWDFAQTFAAKKMIQLGVVLCCCSALASIKTIDEATAVIIGLAVLIAGVIGLLIVVERAIQRKFN